MSVITDLKKPVCYGGPCITIYSKPTDTVTAYLKKYGMVSSYVFSTFSRFASATNPMKVKLF